MSDLTQPLRERDPDLLRAVLLYYARHTTQPLRDSRDTMIDLAGYHVVAQHIGADPAAIFDAVADAIAPGQLADLLRVFGRRTDVNERTFGWSIVDTPEGPDAVFRWPESRRPR